VEPAAPRLPLACRTRWLLAAALAAGAFALYARTAGYPFILYDDPQYVAENARVRAGLTLDNVRWALGTLHFSNWHPLTWLSYMLDVELFGPAPGPMHLVNAALHAANAALLFLVLVRATGARGRSLVVAALFAVHPLHVESVAWISERKDVLSTLLGLAAIGLYVRYARRPEPARLLPVVLAFALSLMAKAMLVTLPLLLLLLDAWPLRRLAPWAAGEGPFPRVSPGRALLEKVPLLAMSAAASAVAIVAQGRGNAILEDSSLPGRLSNAAMSYGRYLAKTLWPVDLAIFYPLPPGGFPAWQLAGAVVLLAALTAGAVALHRRAPYLAVGWLWFLVALVPVIGLVQVGAQAMADRYHYLPGIGLLVALVFGVHALAGRVGLERGPAALCSALAVAVLAGATFRQIGLWRDDETLFRHAIAVTEGNDRAHGVLGLRLRADRRLPEALAELREAARLRPGSARHWTNVGVVSRDLGLLPEAREALVRATGLDPGSWRAWVALSDVERDAGNPAAALEALERAVRAGPADAATWSNLGVQRQAAGREEEAGEAFVQATRADPGSAQAWGNLGIFHAQAGRAAEAARALGEAVRLEPGNPKLLRLLATAQLGNGQRAAALATLDALARVDPAAAAQVRALAGQ